MSDETCDLGATQHFAKGCSGDGGKGAKWWREKHAARRAEYTRLRADGKSYREIGEIYGVTGQAVRQAILKEKEHTVEAIDPLLSRAALKLLGITFSRQHLWELERTGRFPARVQLGTRSIAWRQSEIAAWLAARPRGELKRPEGGESAPVERDGLTAYRRQLREFPR